MPNVFLGFHMGNSEGRLGPRNDGMILERLRVEVCINLAIVMYGLL